MATQSETKTRDEPSEEALNALLAVYDILERISPTDRGYVTRTIIDRYGVPNAVRKKILRADAKHTADVRQGKKPPAEKLSWKQEYEATLEYQAWQHAIKRNRENPGCVSEEEYQEVKLASFRRRDEFKKSSSAKTVSESDPAKPDSLSEETPQTPAKQRIAALRSALSTHGRKVLDRYAVSLCESSEDGWSTEVQNLYQANSGFRKAIHCLCGTLQPSSKPKGEEDEYWTSVKASLSEVAADYA